MLPTAPLTRTTQVGLSSTHDPQTAQGTEKRRPPSSHTNVTRLRSAEQLVQDRPAAVRKKEGLLPLHEPAVDT